MRPAFRLCPSLNPLLLTRCSNMSRIFIMKTGRGLGKNIFWVVFLVGFFVGMGWLPGGSGNPPAAHALTTSMGQNAKAIHPGKSMPASCPMKGNLPCCKGKLRITLCQASPCVLSKPSQGTPVFGTARIYPPTLRIIPGSSLNPPKPMVDAQSLHAPFPSRFSFSSPVNRPLLI